jgi:hypothetical protein
MATYDMKEPLGITERLCVHSSSAKFVANAVSIAKVGNIGISYGMLILEIGKHTIRIWLEDHILPEYELVLAKEHKTVVYVSACDMTNALNQIRWNHHRLKPVERDIVSLSDPGADNNWIDIYCYRYRAMIMGAELL